MPFEVYKNKKEINNKYKNNLCPLNTMVTKIFSVEIFIIQNVKKITKNVNLSLTYFKIDNNILQTAELLIVVATEIKSGNLKLN